MSNNNPNYRRDRRDRNDGYGGWSNESMPPSKRPRQQYDNRQNFNQRFQSHFNNNMGGGNFQHANYYQHPEHPREHRTEPSQPFDPNQMKTFKQFISDLPDNITEEAAANKYKDYKIEFKKTHAKQFFDKYKEHEWLLEKYHPVHLKKRLEEQRQSRKRRLNAFLDLIDRDWFRDVKLDYREDVKLELFLDAVIVKLEGGTDDDLQLLLQESQYKIPTGMKMISEDAEKLKLEQSTKQNEFLPENSNDPDPNRLVGDDDNNDIKVEKDDEDKNDSNDKSNNNDRNDKNDKNEKNDKIDNTDTKDNNDNNDNNDNSDNNDNKDSNDNNNDNLINDEVRIKEEDEGIDCDDKPSCPGEVLEQPEIKTEDQDMEEKDKDESVGQESSVNPTPQSQDLQLFGNDPTPNQSRTLIHKPSSIFLRNLDPSVTKQEIEAFASDEEKFPGFLRVAISDPRQPTHQRRAWVTYRHTDQLRQYCFLYTQSGQEWLKEAAVNREIGKRIRATSGLFQHKTVKKADIKNAVSLITHLDKQRGIWEEEPQTLPSMNESASENEGGDVVKCKNPLLEDIEQYLIEESNTEEHELIGIADEEDVADDACAESTRDQDLERVLDRLLLYLRVVHSVDYYNASEYPGEDDMPTRLGIMFTRGYYPGPIKPQDIKAIIRNHQIRVRHLMEEESLSEAEQKQLGKIDFDELIENFVEANTFQIGEGRWTCTITKKKFMAKEFVRKHILNPTNSAVLPLIEEIKTSAAYFNNYIADPKRPSDITS